MLYCYDGTVHIYRGLAGGKYNTQPGNSSTFTVNLPVAGNPLIADFNGDGIPDLFIPGTKIFYGTGSNLGFTASTIAPYPYTNGFGGVIAADFNLDGIADIAWAYSSDVYVLPSTGPGAFRSRSVTV